MMRSDGLLQVAFKTGLTVSTVILDKSKFKKIFKLFSKRQKDCLWKQRTLYRLENGSLGFIETLHKL